MLKLEQTIQIHTTSTSTNAENKNHTMREGMTMKNEKEFQKESSLFCHSVACRFLILSRSLRLNKYANTTTTTTNKSTIQATYPSNPVTAIRAFNLVGLSLVRWYSICSWNSHRLLTWFWFCLLHSFWFGQISKPLTAPSMKIKHKISCCWKIYFISF